MDCFNALFVGPSSFECFLENVFNCFNWDSEFIFFVTLDTKLPPKNDIPKLKNLLLLDYVLEIDRSINRSIFIILTNYLIFPIVALIIRMLKLVRLDFSIRC